jgi:chitin synthase
VNRDSPGTSASLLSRSSEDASATHESTRRLISTPPGDGSFVQGDPESQGLDYKVARNLQTGAVYRQGTTANRYPEETSNPYGYSQPQTAGNYSQTGDSLPSLDDGEFYTSTSQPAVSGRGVNLIDSGPVSSGDGVRRLSRPGARRPTSTVQSATERYSRVSNSHSPGSSLAVRLPPGAAPPQPGNYGY